MTSTDDKVTVANQIFFEYDVGFSLDFDVQFDLSGMSDVRMLIKKPTGEEDFYDFSAGELTDVEVGGTLSYKVRSGDLAAGKGRYLFQPISKDAEVDLGFSILGLDVRRRIIKNHWQA